MNTQTATTSSNLCEQFPTGSRLRAICEGTADLPLGKLNAYRAQMNLPPIHGVDGEPPNRMRRGRRTTAKTTGNHSGGCRGCGGSGKNGTKAVPLVPNGWGPGSTLLQAFDLAGVPHCPKCIELAAQMDRWGRDGCLRKLDHIVADILPRAREWMAENHSWTHKLLSITHAEDAALRVAIRAKVQAAIDDSPASDPRRNGNVQIDRKGFPSGRHWSRSFRTVNGTPAYVTTDQLIADTLSLIPKLPADITAVAGSARSGLIPASLVAMMLHLPMTIIRNRQGDYAPAGHGWRLLEGAPSKRGRMLVIDDTTMTGNSLLRMKQVLGREPSEKIWASVYCNPAAVNKPDFWARDLPWPHLLEWNLFNSVLLDSFALDFDGILCHDCQSGDDDDGLKYVRFLQDTRPLYLVRKRPIKLIITARLEKYRELTTAWMERWGVTARQIVMGPWSTIRERRASDVAAWKAEMLERHFSGRTSISPKFYIESNPADAERIANLTGRLVVCPAAKRCFGKAK